MVEAWGVGGGVEGGGTQMEVGEETDGEGVGEPSRA